MLEEEFARTAKALAHLAALWRDRGDLEALARLPDGTVEIDILAGTARHESEGPVPLRLAAELKSALAERWARKGIPWSEAEAAALGLRADTRAVRTDRARIVHFDFDLELRLRAGGRDYRSSRREEHVWHEREAE